MALREIVTWPHPILKQRCEEIADFGGDLHTLLDDMAETMQEADGLGLAANQVGDRRRVFVMGLPTENEDEYDVLEVLNPVIESRRGESKVEEGCLSFPEVFQAVVRAQEVTVSFDDRNGQRQSRTFGGISAICFQHELDHLDGITFIERLSPLKRRLTLRAYNRAQKQRLFEAQEAEFAGIRGSN